jgi:hypothetical protein
VRVFRRFALCVMLSVDRHPLLGHHPGGHPKPESKQVTDAWVQIQRAMRLISMQIDRDGGDRDVRQPERDQRIGPPPQVEESGEGHHRICLRNVGACAKELVSTSRICYVVSFRLRALTEFVLQRRVQLVQRCHALQNGNPDSIRSVGRF